MKFTMITLICILTFFSCEDAKTNSTNEPPVQYSTVKGFVYDKETGVAIIYGYYLNNVYIKNGGSSPVIQDGTYELQNIENGEQVIFTICKNYKDFKDTIQVSGTEFLFDVALERKDEITTYFKRSGR